MLEYRHMQSNPDGEVIKDLSEKIKATRERLGLTQADVAKKAGMTVNYYAMIERGEVNPTYNKLKSIARFLKIKITIS